MGRRPQALCSRGGGGLPGAAGSPPVPGEGPPSQKFAALWLMGSPAAAVRPAQESASHSSGSCIHRPNRTSSAVFNSRGFPTRDQYYSPHHLLPRSCDNAAMLQTSVHTIAVMHTKGPSRDRQVGTSRPLGWARGLAAGATRGGQPCTPSASLRGIWHKQKWGCRERCDAPFVPGRCRVCSSVPLALGLDGCFPSSRSGFPLGFSPARSASSAPLPELLPPKRWCCRIARNSYSASRLMHQ